jgi:hypothetical protein
MSKYAALIGAIRKYRATTTIPGVAEIMGNMAEFLAAMAEDAAQQTEENLKLQRKVVWLTVALAALTVVLLGYTIALYEFARADTQHRDFKQQQLQTPLSSLE